jgi:hypothetical protein
MWPNRKQHRSGTKTMELDFGDRVGGRRHARAQHRRRSELIRPTSGSAHISASEEAYSTSTADCSNAYFVGWNTVLTLSTLRVMDWLFLFYQVEGFGAWARG